MVWCEYLQVFNLCVNVFIRISGNFLWSSSNFCGIIHKKLVIILSFVRIWYLFSLILCCYCYICVLLLHLRTCVLLLHLRTCLVCTVCVYEYMCMCLCVCAYVYVCIYVHVSLCVCVFVHICICLCVYILMCCNYIHTVCKYVKFAKYSVHFEATDINIILKKGFTMAIHPAYTVL